MREDMVYVKKRKRERRKPCNPRRNAVAKDDDLGDIDWDSVTQACECGDKDLDFTEGSQISVFEILH